MNWTQRTDNQTAYRRATGRRRYNRARQLAALDNQVKALNLRSQGHSPAEIGQMLGVSRVTVWRYLKPYNAPFDRPAHHYIKRAYGLRFEWPPGRWSLFGVR